MTYKTEAAGARLPNSQNEHEEGRNIHRNTVPANRLFVFILLITLWHSYKGFNSFNNKYYIQRKNHMIITGVNHRKPQTVLQKEKGVLPRTFV